MWLLPWRKEVLGNMIQEITDQEDMDGKDRKFIKAAIVIL
jgi:hypothetical protein